jgi:hypothetical protein
MIDYGLKTPTRMRILVPTTMPYCSECKSGLELHGLDTVTARATLFHPKPAALLQGADPCKYAGRYFELELDIRYLKEVAKP